MLKRLWLRDERQLVSILEPIQDDWTRSNGSPRVQVLPDTQEWHDGGWRAVPTAGLVRPYLEVSAPLAGVEDSAVLDFAWCPLLLGLRVLGLELQDDEDDPEAELSLTGL